MKLVISLRALFSEELSQSQWMVTPTFPGLKLIWSSFSLNSISDPSGYSLVLPPEHLQNLPASPYFASQSSPRHRGLSSGWKEHPSLLLPSSTLGEIWEASFLVLCHILPLLKNLQQLPISLRIKVKFLPVVYKAPTLCSPISFLIQAPPLSPLFPLQPQGPPCCISKHIRHTAPKVHGLFPQFTQASFSLSSFPKKYLLHYPICNCHPLSHPQHSQSP